MTLLERLAHTPPRRYGPGVTHWRYLDLEELRDLYESACCLHARFRLSSGERAREVAWPGADIERICPEHGGPTPVDLLCWKRARAIRERHIEEHIADCRRLAVDLVELA